MGARIPGGLGADLKIPVLNISLLVGNEDEAVRPQFL